MIFNVNISYPHVAACDADIVWSDPIWDRPTIYLIIGSWQLLEQTNDIMFWLLSPVVRKIAISSFITIILIVHDGNPSNYG